MTRVITRQRSSARAQWWTAVQRLGLRPRHLPYLIPFIVGFIAAQTWFEPGAFIASGDLAPFLAEGLEDEYGSLWNHVVSGAGSSNFQITLAAQVGAVNAVTGLGGTEILAQRLFFGFLFGGVGLGGAYFTGAFPVSRVLAGVTGIVALFNPFLLTQALNPPALIAIGLMGVLGGMILRTARGQAVRPGVFALVTVGTSYLAQNPPLLIICVLWVAVVALSSPLVYGAGSRERVFSFLGKAAIWSVLLNLWWLIPLGLSLTSPEGADFAAVTNIQDWSWTHARSGVVNVLSLNSTWAWEFADYYPYSARLDQAPWGVLRFLLPIAALSAPLIARREHRRVTIVMLGAIGVIALLSKGLHPPLSSVNLWLYEHVPGLWLIREPAAKLGPALLLIYLALIGIGFTGLLDRAARARRNLETGSVALLTVVVGFTAVYSYPLWTGDVVPDRRPQLPSAHVRIPSSWVDLANYLNAEPNRGKVLVLPLDDYYQMPTVWGYYGIDIVPQLMVRKPILQRMPGTYFSLPASVASLLQSTETALTEEQPEGVPRLLEALGVSHVILRRDLDLQFPGRSFTPPDLIAAGLGEELLLKRSFDVGDVYQLGNPPPSLVRTYTDVEDLPPGSEQEPGPLVAALDAGEVLLTGDSLAIGEVSGADVGVPPQLTWTRSNPATYNVEIAEVDGPFVLTLAEAFSDSWVLEGLPTGARSRHLVAHGYANAWRIQATGPLSLTISHRPSGWARLATWVSLGAGCVLILLNLTMARRRKHHDGRASRREST